MRAATFTLPPTPDRMFYPRVDVEWPSDHASPRANYAREWVA
ncbi:hypothetical protein DB30_05244 [Enhygromyxa salina]|uniref:Uncharacterized protein n=1 Tax=Enhygromyxa salina TaxID=215803 RepID=A0A0C2CXV4_9BACT|nr:hypothetical protein DB30_05244 [Enhygromyxa salina]